MATAAAAGTRGLLGPDDAVAGDAAGVANTGPASAAVPPPWKHAIGDPRGSDIAITSGRVKEARFGLMFKKPEAFTPPDELLHDLAARMGEPADAVLDNPDIPAGFTFLGQFIDHDMTLDRTPMPQQQADPNGLVNFDTPRFDLGSVYGRGPALDPDLYEPDGIRMRIGRTGDNLDDLPRRSDGMALLGDPRNDENLIIAQLHLLFLKFHNRCLDTGLATTLAEAQRLTRWHFQWVIVHDFLARVAGADVVARFFKGSPPKVQREFYKPANPNRPMMPVEYSVAAYRFGHSMVRAGYTLNAAGGAPMFDPLRPDLRGSRPLPPYAQVEWWRLYAVPGQPAGPRNQARLIDDKLAIPLLNLPPTVVRDPMVSLAERNLIRGKRLGLPAGQDVAAAMGIAPLSNTDLGLPNPDNPGWRGKAPLWFYILREAAIHRGGRRLGPVGGRIVTEVILGILDTDKTSYLHAKTPFQPGPPIAPNAEFTMGDLVAFATGG